MLAFWGSKPLDASCLLAIISSSEAPMEGEYACWLYHLRLMNELRGFPSSAEISSPSQAAPSDCSGVVGDAHLSEQPGEEAAAWSAAMCLSIRTFCSSSVTPIEGEYAILLYAARSLILSPAVILPPSVPLTPSPASSAPSGPSCCGVAGSRSPSRGTASSDASFSRVGAQEEASRALDAAAFCALIFLERSLDPKGELSEAIVANTSSSSSDEAQALEPPSWGGVRVEAVSNSSPSLALNLAPVLSTVLGSEPPALPSTFRGSIAPSPEGRRRERRALLPSERGALGGA
mmetsp:Transcript_40222/g.94171  ORF Transcript_40222/g.94171 Transcript_40222/m.94171 type:complete len:290 (-) Transcript_40222:468-1337(-)